MLAEIPFSSYEEELISLRRQFHKIPELCYQEEKTSDAIIKLLKSYGITRTERVFRTGVVAVIGDESKECIAFRMDIDGLPVEEKTGVSYQSEHPGTMHACGHDAHIAILLMTAKILKEYESSLTKCIKLIFQPGEEGDGGALPMIQEGVLENPAVRKVFGAHVWPDVPLGTFEFSEKAAFAGCDRFEITFLGKGGHGAMPEKVISPLPAAAECILELQSLHKRNENAVVSACAVHADGYHNVFPDNAVILGTIRTLNDTDRTKILSEIELLCQNISEKYTLPVRFEPVREYPPCVNHPDILEEYRETAVKVAGADGVRQGSPTYAAEDFSYFANSCPSAHVRIGSQSGEETSFALHNPRFNIDERCLINGVKLFCTLALNEK